jgi:hypothetical protein
MPDLDLIKEGEQEARERRGRRAWREIEVADSFP